MAVKYPEAVLLDALNSDATLATLGVVAIKPLLADADTAPPFITWRRVNTEREHTFSGATGAVKTTYAFTSYATTYIGSRQVADAVRQVLDGLGGTVDNTTVSHVRVSNESDGLVQLAGSELPPVYAIEQTVETLWQEI